ncbi:MULTISPECIES: hypothetical protein [Bacillus cereus group]|uniref:hypothetical protein n=1 Tax=Bacillus cereus group TaxID=86661 RepID=UPI000279EB0E|nr:MULTISPECIES: hypothetical protein [Bacillus cereus group]EJR25910.1 hypothetical protein IIE_06165 [Bacillus cereus VD045]
MCEGKEDIRIPLDYDEIGECDLCEKDSRYLKHGYDNFGVHVINHCMFGCNNEKSTFHNSKCDIEKELKLNNKHL